MQLTIVARQAECGTKFYVENPPAEFKGETGINQFSKVMVFYHEGNGEYNFLRSTSDAIKRVTEEYQVTFKLEFKPLMSKDGIFALYAEEHWGSMINEQGEWCYKEEEEGNIKLSNNSFLMNKFGKYQPNLCLLNTVPYINCFKEKANWSKFNLGNEEIEILYGNFFISKKGSNCFRILPQDKATDILICDDWGGAFSKYRGKSISKTTEGVKYYRCAHSNGGGCGTDYIIVSKDWQYQMSEEDI